MKFNFNECHKNFRRISFLKRKNIYYSNQDNVYVYFFCSCLFLLNFKWIERKAERRMWCRMSPIHARPRLNIMSGAFWTECRIIVEHNYIQSECIFMLGAIGAIGIEWTNEHSTAPSSILYKCSDGGWRVVFISIIIQIKFYYIKMFRNGFLLNNVFNW